MYLSAAEIAFCQSRLISNSPSGAKATVEFLGRLRPVTLPPMLASVEKFIRGTVRPLWRCLVPASTAGTCRGPRPGLDGARDTTLVAPALTVTGDRPTFSFHSERNQSYMPWVA